MAAYYPNAFVKTFTNTDLPTLEGAVNAFLLTESNTKSFVLMSVAIHAVVVTTTINYVAMVTYGISASH